MPREKAAREQALILYVCTEQVLIFVQWLDTSRPCCTVDLEHNHAISNSGLVCLQTLCLSLFHKIAWFSFTSGFMQSEWTFCFILVLSWSTCADLFAVVVGKIDKWLKNLWLSSTLRGHCLKICKNNEVLIYLNIVMQAMLTCLIILPMCQPNNDQFN